MTSLFSHNKSIWYPVFKRADTCNSYLPSQHRLCYTPIETTTCNSFFNIFPGFGHIHNGTH